MSKVPASTALIEVQEAFRSVKSELEPFQKGYPDFNGRRFVNVGDAKKDNEWITRGQAAGLFEPKHEPEPSANSSIIKAVRIDTYANRGPAFAFPFTFFEASDRNYIAWASNGNAWLWSYGIHRDTFANRPSAGALTTSDLGYQFLATDRNWLFRYSGSAWVLQEHLSQPYRNSLANIPTLGTGDAGALFFVTDYYHLLRWTGTAWEFGQGDSGSGYVAVGKPDGSAPNGGLWGICDGSAYNVLKADGTTESLTTQDLNDDTFILGGATIDATPRVAIRGKWEATAKTDKAVSGITLDAHTTRSDIPTTGAATVLTGPVSHTITEPNAGAGHEHVLSDAIAQLKVPSEANGGVPKRSGVAFYLRR